MPIYGQDKDQIILKWGVDSIKYRTCFDELNKEFPDSIQLKTEIDSNGEHIVTLIKQLNKEFLEASFLSKVIKEENDFYSIHLSISGFNVSNTKADLYGNPINNLPPEENNFYLFFFKLPNNPVKIGDTWKMGLNVPKDLSAIALNDSIKEDQIKLEAIRTIENSNIAVLSYNYKEEYIGTWKNPETSKNELAKISFIYKAIGEFDIEKGKWKELDGAIDITVVGPMNGRSIRHVCMQEIQ